MSEKPGIKPFVALQSDRATSRRRLAASAIYAVQVIVCASLLFEGYRAVGAPLVQWAIISAVLVLQPGVKSSLQASTTRIAANLVGCVLGVTVGMTVGDGFPQVLLALVICVFLCDRLRLDAALRSACVAVVIVMMYGDRSLLHSSIARAGDVVVGSSLAVAVQAITDALRQRVSGKTPTSAPDARSSAAGAAASCPDHGGE